MAKIAIRRHQSQELARISVAWSWRGFRIPSRCYVTPIIRSPAAAVGHRTRAGGWRRRSNMSQCRRSMPPYRTQQGEDKARCQTSARSWDHPDDCDEVRSEAGRSRGARCAPRIRRDQATGGGTRWRYQATAKANGGARNVVRNRREPVSSSTWNQLLTSRSGSIGANVTQSRCSVQVETVTCCVALGSLPPSEERTQTNARQTRRHVLGVTRRACLTCLAHPGSVGRLVKIWFR